MADPTDTPHRTESPNRALRPSGDPAPSSRPYIVRWREHRDGPTHTGPGHRTYEEALQARDAVRQTLRDPSGSAWVDYSPVQGAELSRSAAEGVVSGPADTSRTESPSAEQECADCGAYLEPCDDCTPEPCIDCGHPDGDGHAHCPAWCEDPLCERCLGARGRALADAAIGWVVSHA